METLIGRLTHLSFIMPQVKHSLSRLWHLISRANNRWEIFIAKRYITDLHMHRKFLQAACKGISMNLIKY